MSRRSEIVLSKEAACIPEKSEKLPLQSSRTGNEVRRDGRQGVGASQSSAEAGELAPEDPVEGSEASVGRLDRGNHAEHIEVHSHVHGTRTDSRGDPCMIDSGQSAILAPVS